MAGRRKDKAAGGTAQGTGGRSKRGRARGQATARRARRKAGLEAFFWVPEDGAKRVGAPPAEASAGAEFLAFWLAGERYALPIDALREIVRLPAVTEVPRTPPHVLGVATLRGEVLPILDLRPRLGLAEAEPTSKARVLVVRSEEGPAGLLVEAVEEVVRVEGAVELEAPPAVLGHRRELLQGLLRAGDRILAVLDPERALAIEGPSGGKA
ncbi:MAG: purine-binding chemotaxis protein CheW [Deltaproteobacteria bacterium]|nr:MAG: purine-binding chemotaxis protein CheW [Deltaproteobacteria bacterium]